MTQTKKPDPERESKLNQWKTFFFLFFILPIGPSGGVLQRFIYSE